MNVGTFAGRVGQDAELKSTSSGKSVASFNIAVDNGKDSEGEKRAPTWIKCTLWEKKADALAQYIKKGKMVIVSGPVNSEAWASKQDGALQSRVVVTVREFTFGGGDSSDKSESVPAPKKTAADPITDEDIPF